LEQNISIFLIYYEIMKMFDFMLIIFLQKKISILSVFDTKIGMG